MFRDFHDKAVVSALHRLHLLRLFDVIYVLDRGQGGGARHAGRTAGVESALPGTLAAPDDAAQPD